jgi:hypothetical protein
VQALCGFQGDAARRELFATAFASPVLLPAHMRTFLFALACVVGAHFFTGCALFPESSPEERQARAEACSAQREIEVQKQIEREKREQAARAETWLPGRLASVADGTVLPMRIEKVWVFGQSGNGGISATHPKTGETFSGRYSAIRESSTSGSAAIVNLRGQQVGTARYTARGRNASAIATLTGDQGTIIQVQMQIVSGWSPHGVGTGTDNKGNYYQLDF